MKKFITFVIVLAFAVSAFALESEPSDVVGYVKYDLTTTDGTDFNFIALALDAGYSMAGELGDAIGTGSECNVVSKWVPADQGWEQASDLGYMWTNNFDVETGQAYMVNITSADVTEFCSAGDLPDPPTFNLITTAGTDFNFIMVPLNTSFSMAGDLGDDIGTGSECNVVSKWVPADQGWYQASDLGYMWTNNFAVDIADPLMLNVTDDVTWP